MKKFFKIFGIVLLCVAIVCGGVFVWQKDHIMAIINAVKYSDEELSEKLVSTQEELKQTVESFAGEELREYTEEELGQIERGEVTKDEVMAKIINEAVEKKISKKEPEDTNEQKTKEKEAEIIINEHIAQMYSLKSSYLGQIDAMLATAAAEYYSMAEGGAKGKETKQVLIPKYMGILSGLEKQCDAKVEGVLSSLMKELKARNQSLDIVKTIRSAYENEKSIKMAQIINEYK
ncbi:MAG: hypothetical protein J6L59_05125 [Clostridia bacterium]|nr:hypothetical protein [Clostridia bacterium]